MAVKLDRETLAITALVGAMLIFFFSGSDKDDDPEQKKGEDAALQVAELENHLRELEGQLDDLHEELERNTPEIELPRWVREKLNEMAKTVHQLGLNAQNTKVGETWFERLEHLRETCSDYLRAHGDEMEMRERFRVQKDRQGTAPQHITMVQNHMHATQNVDRRTQKYLKMVDERTFQQANFSRFEMRDAQMGARVQPHLRATHEFEAAGPSGSAAIRDQQRSNTATSTNALEKTRPHIVAQWGDVSVIQEDPSGPRGALVRPKPKFHPPMTRPDVLRLAKDIARTENLRTRGERQPLMLEEGEIPLLITNFESAPAEGADNHDDPPAVPQNQLVVRMPMTVARTDNFNSESDGTMVSVPQLTKGQLEMRQFKTIMAQVDGLIDALAGMGNDAPGFRAAGLKIKGLISQHDKAYGDTVHASDYGLRRDVWAGRLAKIQARDKGIEREKSGGLDANEQRRKREESKLKLRKRQRDEAMARSRTRSRSGSAAVGQLDTSLIDLTRASPSIPPSRSPTPTVQRSHSRVESLSDLSGYGGMTPESQVDRRSRSRSERSVSTEVADDFTQLPSTGGIAKRGGGI